MGNLLSTQDELSPETKKAIEEWKMLDKAMRQEEARQAELDKPRCCKLSGYWVLNNFAIVETLFRLIFHCLLAFLGLFPYAFTWGKWNLASKHISHHVEWIRFYTTSVADFLCLNICHPKEPMYVYEHDVSLTRPPIPGPLHGSGSGDDNCCDCCNCNKCCTDCCGETFLNIYFGILRFMRSAYCVFGCYHSCHPATVCGPFCCECCCEPMADRMKRWQNELELERRDRTARFLATYEGEYSGDWPNRPTLGGIMGEINGNDDASLIGKGKENSMDRDSNELEETKDVKPSAPPLHRTDSESTASSAYASAEEVLDRV